MCRVTETEGLVSASQKMFVSIPEVTMAAVSIAEMVIECIMRKKRHLPLSWQEFIADSM